MIKNYLYMLFFFLLNDYSFSFFDSVLYNVEGCFQKYVETNRQYIIYSFMQEAVLEEVKSKKNKASLIAQKILLLSMMCEAFVEKKCISKEIMKKKLNYYIKKINKKKPFNNNYFSFLMIDQAYYIFNNIKNYNDYCISIAPHWFNQESYFEDNIEYKGPQIKKIIDKSNLQLIDENNFASSYFIFIYALTKIVHDTIK